MTAHQTIDYLKTLVLVQALWWFIENSDPSNDWNNEVFFYLRERVRLAGL